MKRIIIGSDLSGFSLKEAVKEHVQKSGYEVCDVGTLSPDNPVDFYEVGIRLGQAVSNKEFDRGIIICGTGMGVSLIANKFKGVYCGLCESLFAVNRARTYNNINVLGMGGFLIGHELGKKMVDEFLQTEFTSGEDAETVKLLQKAYDVMESL